MSNATNFRELQSSPCVATFTAAGLSADEDLTASSGGKPGYPIRWIMYDGGDVVITDMSGSNKTLNSAFAGIPIPVQATVLVDTGTTATQIIVGW